MVVGVVVAVLLLGELGTRAVAERTIPSAESGPPQDPYAASASPEPPSPPRAARRPRRGKLVGASIGAGAVCSETSCLNVDALSRGFHVGGFVFDRVALVADYWLVTGTQPMVENNDVATRIRSVISVGAQVWVTSRLWIRASVGRVVMNTFFRRLETTIDGDHVPSVSAMAGFEVWQAPGYAVDLRVRAGTESYGEQRWGGAAVDMAVSWF